jgi:SAM-dependent methyltransferase
MFDTKALDASKVTFGHIDSPGVRFVKRIIINLDEIYIPPIKKDNSTRSSGKSVPHIQRLENSFSNGIDYSKMPPTIRLSSQLIDGIIKKYELVTGNHRLEALRRLGYKEWIFDLYEIPSDTYGYEDSIRTFQLKENDHAPSYANSEQDVVNTIVRLVAHSSKLVEPNEDSIADYVNSVCSNMHHSTRAKIVRDVVRQLVKNGCSVYRDVITYTAKDVEDFLSNNTDYVCAGNFDFVRKKYGWSVLEGYEYEFLVNATKRFAEKGIESYFTIHTKSPTELYSVNDRRAKMVQQFQTLESSLIKVFEHYTKTGKFPWSIEGALPQDIGNDEESYIKM